MGKSNTHSMLMLEVVAAFNSRPHQVSLSTPSLGAKTKQSKQRWYKLRGTSIEGNKTELKTERKRRGYIYMRSCSLQLQPGLHPSPPPKKP